MNDFGQLISQVQHNCAVSDSRYAGLYSVCGLALRLIDLYKWEKELGPWVEKEASEILEWIDRKEDSWASLSRMPFERLNVFGKKLDPFDTHGVNRILTPRGLYYGAGFGRRLKPTFFLSIIENKTRINGRSVFFLGKELARDLFAVPALTQDDTILIRQKTAEVMLWDQMTYVSKSGRKALEYALLQLGLDGNDRSALQANLMAIMQEAITIFLHHELGELNVNVLDRRVWRDILETYPQSPVELFARAIKDILADTCAQGTLNYIVAEKRCAALGFYVAFQEGIYKVLFPEIKAVFDRFVQTGDWGVIEGAMAAGYEASRSRAKQMVAIFQNGKDKNDLKWAEKEIIHQLMKPLKLSS